MQLAWKQEEKEEAWQRYKRGEKLRDIAIAMKRSPGAICSALYLLRREREPESILPKGGVRKTRCAHCGAVIRTRDSADI